MRSRRLRSIVLAGCALAGFAANSSAQFVASWTSAASGTWTNAANWSTNPAFPNNNSPAVGDTYDAVIDAVGPAYTVTLDSPITLNSLHLNSPSATLQQNGGTLTLVNGGTISAGSFRLNADALVGGGPLRVAGGMLQFDQATQSTVSLAIENDSLIVVNRGSINLSNGTLINRNSVYLGAGTPVAVTGSGSSALLNSGNIMVSSGSGITQLNLPVSNSGTITVATGFLRFGAGTHTHLSSSTLAGAGSFLLGNGTSTTFHRWNGTLNLGATATVPANCGIVAFPGGMQMNITGTLNHNGGSISGGFINVAQSGTLNLQGGSFSGGFLNNHGITRIIGSVPTPTSFVNEMAGRIYLLSNSATTLSFGTNSLSNLGTIYCNQTNSATLILSGAGTGVINNGTVVANTGTFAFGGDVHLRNGSVITGGATINLTAPGARIFTEGSTTLSGSRMFFSGGTIAGAGDIHLTSVMEWNSGTMLGDGISPTLGTFVVHPGAVLTNTFGTPMMARNLDNFGQITFNRAPNWSLGSLRNFESGTLNFREFNLGAFGLGGLGSFSNEGVMNLSPAGSIQLHRLINSGTLVAQTGTLNLIDTTFNGNSFLDGVGTVQIPGCNVNGTLTIAGAFTRYTGPSLFGTGRVVVESRLDWTSGFINLGGPIDIAASGVMNVLPQSGGFSQLSSTLNNFGALNFFEVTIGLHGVLNNASTGIVNFLAETTPFNGFNANTAFNNYGTIVANSSGSVSLFLPALNNSGTIVVANGTLFFASSIPQLQTTTLSGGAWIVNSTGSLVLNGGRQILRNETIISLIGPSSSFPALDVLQDNAGTLSLRLGRSFTAAGSFTNSGVINIDNGGALFVNDALFNSGTINGLVIQTGSSTLSGNSYIKSLRGGDVFVETSAAARVDYLDAAALSIANQADLTLGAGSIAHVIDILNIAPAHGTLSAGRLDLLSGRLVIDYTGSSPADAVAQLLATGFNNGDWLGRGITSSSILTGSNFAVGMIESAEIFSMGGTFAGVNVDNTALLLDRTLKGDANLDYTVNITDFAIVAANFNAPTKWSKGDFNYDGVTNIADFALLAANFNQSLPADLPRQSIPEPTAIGLVALVSLMWRRVPARL